MSADPKPATSNPVTGLLTPLVVLGAAGDACVGDECLPSGAEFSTAPDASV